MEPGAPGNYQQPGSWQPPMPPPAPALQFASTWRRFFAYLIDAIVLGIIGVIVDTVLAAVGLYAVRYAPGQVNPDVNVVGLLAQLVVGLAISAAYFVYTWTTMRATVGMRLLSLQIGNEGNGATLTTEQAARRWAYLALPGALITVALPLGLGILLIVELVVIAYYIALLYTTATSPTKQGLHDRWAHTQVVSSAY